VAAHLLAFRELLPQLLTVEVGLPLQVLHGFLRGLPAQLVLAVSRRLRSLFYYLLLAEQPVLTLQPLHLLLDKVIVLLASP